MFHLRKDHQDTQQKTVLLDPQKSRSPSLSTSAGNCECNHDGVFGENLRAETHDLKASQSDSVQHDLAIVRRQHIEMAVVVKVRRDRRIDIPWHLQRHAFAKELHDA